MTNREFKFAKLAVVFFLALIVSQAVTLNNFPLALIGIALGIGLMFFLRRQVKGVVADERDYAVAGQAARLSLTISSALMCLLVLTFIFMRDSNPVYETIGVALAYAACAQMLIYSLVFGYLNRAVPAGRRIGYIVAGVIVGLLLVIAGLRLLSGEDSWVCDGGQWVKHGQPSSPQPTGVCED